MLSLALALLIVVAQPDDAPVSTQQVVPPPSAAAMAEARRKADEKRVKDEAERKRQEAADDAILLDWANGSQREMVSPAEAGKFNWGFTPKADPAQTDEEKRAAANRAALERAEQAGRDANEPPGAWPDEGKMRCKTTESGFVCGNSDKALEEDSPSRKALEEIMKPN